MEAYNLLLNYNTLHSKLTARLVEDPEEVSFGNVGGDKGGIVNKNGRVRGGRGKKVWCYCCIKLVHIARECLNQKEAVADNAGGEKEEEGEVNLNVQEEDVDDYGDVGNLLFLQYMILQKG